MVIQIFQKIFNKISSSVEKTIGITDSLYKIVASSNPNDIGKDLEVNIEIKKLESQDLYSYNNYTYKVLGNKQIGVWCVYCEGSEEHSKSYVSILTATLNEAINYYVLKYDKCSFIKDIILENILPSDVTIRQNELKIQDDILRVCIILRSLKPNDNSFLEILQSIFSDKEKDFSIRINDSDVVIVKDISNTITNEDLKKLVLSLIDTLANNYYIKCVGAVGSIVKNLRHLSKSYRNAQIALEVRKIFGDKNIVALYNQLGLSRLIYQLPETLCKNFLDEVFKKRSIDAIDGELMFTINKFFENSLNVSETSRKLFVHRNTLVYRIEKIERITGLDLREFEDAIIFKIALMVNKYLKEKPVRY